MVFTQRSRVLAAFVAHSFCNQLMFMDFAAVPLASREALAIDDEDVNSLYTVSLIAAIPSIFASLAFISSHNWATSFCGVASTVAAAWIRFAAVTRASYALAVLSSACLGLGVGIVFVGFTQIPKDWFSEQEQPVAMAVAVQMTFFGWATGGLLIPTCVTSASDLASFSLAQAVVLSVCLALFLACHASPPPPPRPDGTCQQGDAAGEEGQAARREEEEGRPGGPAPPALWESLRLMARNGPYLQQSCASGLLQGVGFTIPAILFEVLEDQGYGFEESALTSFAFIMAGVGLGLLLGQVVPYTATPEVRSGCVLALFWSGTLAVWLLHLVDSYGLGSGSLLQHAAIMALMVVSGSCSLGFVNMALPLVCEAAHPVAECYSGGVTELLGFLMGAVITQLSSGSGFVVCASASLLAASLMSAALVGGLPWRLRLRGVPWKSLPPDLQSNLLDHPDKMESSTPKRYNSQCSGDGQGMGA